MRKVKAAGPLAFFDNLSVKPTPGISVANRELLNHISSI